MTILRHIFTDLILGTEVVKLTFFKNLQNKNILFLRHHIHDLVPFISGAAGHVIVLGFPDKRQKGFVHDFLFFVFQTRGIDSIEDYSTLS